MPLTQAPMPFLFRNQLSLVEMTGLEAKDLHELSQHLKSVPEHSIYYHTHHFLQKHQFLTPEPPNDFAYWVTEVLQEDQVGEQLAAIDTVRFQTLESLRSAVVGVIEKYLLQRPILRKAPEGEEFYFMKCLLFNVPTPHQASNLHEFLDCLKKISIGCLYNHVFQARLRTPS